MHCPTKKGTIYKEASLSSLCIHNYIGNEYENEKETHGNTIYDPFIFICYPIFEENRYEVKNRDTTTTTTTTTLLQDDFENIHNMYRSTYTYL